MKALLVKDFYVIKKNMRFNLLLLLIALLLPLFTEDKPFFVLYSLMIVTVTCISVLTYDENYSFQAYCDTMPIKRSTVVAERYLLAIALNTAAMVIALLVRIPAIVRGSAELSSIVLFLLALDCMSVLGLSVCYPIFFKLGVQRGRMAMFLLVFIIAIASGAVIGYAGDGPSLSALPLPLGVLIAALIVLCVLLYFISYRLSVRFYSRREF